MGQNDTNCDRFDKKVTSSSQISCDTIRPNHLRTSVGRAEKYGAKSRMRWLQTLSLVVRSCREHRGIRVQSYIRAYSLLLVTLLILCITSAAQIADQVHITPMPKPTETPK